MDFFKDHNHKRLFQLLLLSVLALFLSLLSNQAVMAVVEGYCIGENCIYNWWGNGTTDYIARWTGLNSLGDSAIYQSGSNIGIGTTTPAQLLHVAGYARADSGFCIGTSCITAWPQGEVTGSGTANYVPLWTTSSNIGNSAIYQSGSRIGIGTTSPSQLLTVQGTDSDLIKVISSSDVGASISLESTGLNGSAWSIISTANEAWGGGGNLGFINNSFRLYVKADGNVGIGTTSPAQKLHVAGYARADSGFCIGTSCITAWPQGEVTGSGVANYIPRWTTSNSIGNSTIYQSGNNLGINKTNPVARLDINDGEGGGTLVNPTLRISTPVQSGSTEDAIFFYENGNSATGRQAISWYNGNMSYYKARIWTQVGSGYTATLFGIDTADDAMNLATRLAIRNGNVGIGTTSPAQKLHVAGYARADSGFCIGTSCITAWPQGEVTGTGTTNYIPLWTTSSNIGNSVIYQSGSNIGIGTTSPGSTLDVAGNININEGSAYLYDGVQGLKLAKGTDTFYANTFVGEVAGNSTATRQTALGYAAGYSNTGNQQTAVGYYAGRSNIGSDQTALGYYAGASNTGASQTALGYGAGDSNTGTQQTALGYAAGAGNTGSYQTALGYWAGYQNIGNQQTAVGHFAGDSNTEDYQTALGYYAGQANTGFGQTALGVYTGASNTGNYQTALGYYSGQANTGFGQTALGYWAGYSNIGNGQTAVGHFAGYYNLGEYQTAVGYTAGYHNSGHRVTGVGYEATNANTANDVVAIGYQAGKSNAVANQFIIKQANINATPLIQGDFLSGNVGIGTTSPQEKLDVNGNVRANEYYYSSDISLKTGIGYLPGEETLSKVLKLQGVSFKWKESGKSSIGFIAQDVEKIFPELVNTDQNGLKSIQYGNLIAPLVESIKEQQKQIEQLRQEIEELKR